MSSPRVRTDVQLEIRDLPEDVVAEVFARLALIAQAWAADGYEVGMLTYRTPEDGDLEVTAHNVPAAGEGR